MKTFGFQWHLTDRCNMRCAHCYQEGFASDGEQGLETLKAAAGRIFAALPDRRVSINLTGGEPLLLPILFDLIEHLHTYPTLDEVNIITNGTVASDDVIKGIGSFPRVSTLKVSLESADAKINDRIRGEGNLSCVRENIASFRRAGKSIVLMMTLSRFNLASLEDTVRWSREAGMDGVIVERFVPLGLGRGFANQALLPQDWESALHAIARASGIGVDPETLLPFRAFWLSMGPCANPLRGALCNLGGESMALMPDGTVYPCRRFPIVVGNILNEPFEGILKRLEAYCPSEIRPKLNGVRCRTCAVEGCAGCRAIALALTGDALADDPQCPLSARLAAHGEGYPYRGQQQ